MKWLTQLKYIILLLGLFPYNNNIAQSSDSLSSENYSQFFDSIFQNPLSKKVFRGAAFVFVKDGKIMYEKGYGYVDLKKTHKVSPLNSIFYTASVSKIFPALALMQLQQYGKCNMNDDVRKYLGEIQLHNPFHTNVRLINLVTHTAGFEDRFFNAMVKDPAYLRPLDKYFALNMPDIVMEPGTQISYSNHGAALSGLIVQLISGIPFYQFAREHIFAPLAMNHTSFMQPLPDSLGKLIKQGGNYQPYYNPYPAASCVTTADDMGKLLIALMDKTNPVFSKESLEQIFSKQWSSNKNMPGMGIGFMQSWENGQNGYYHTGDAGQHSIIFILPDKKIGFYAVYTNLTEDANNPREELTKTILNKYFPLPKFEMPVPPPGFLKIANEYEGTFRINQYSRSTFEKIFGLPKQASCKLNADGSLQLSLLGGGIKVKIVEKEKDLFIGDDEAYYSFNRNKEGKIIGITITGNISDPTGLEKIKWYDNTFFHLFIIVFIFIMIFSRLILSVIYVLKKIFKKKKDELFQTNSEKWIWKLPAIMSLFIFILPFLTLLGLATAEKPFYDVPVFLQIILTSLTCLALFALSISFLSFYIWKKQFWTKGRRIYYSIFSFAMILFAWFIIYWKL